MYQIKWDQVIPQILPKIIDRRVVRAHGSFFDCQFTLDFEDHSSIQFKCDDIIHRNAIEFEIILNRAKIYNPLHFDSTHIFTNNLGIVIDAREYRTDKRSNVREILILFDAHKKFHRLSEIILHSTKYNKYKLNQSVSDEITAFLQPRNDKMTVRTYRKEMHNLEQKEQEKLQKAEKQKQLIQKLYHEPHQSDSKQDINYTDSVLNLYPIKSDNETDRNMNDSEAIKSLYPIEKAEDDENDRNDIEINDNSNATKDENVKESNSKKRDYDKIYCDVVCRISSWNTFTATARKKKY